MIPRALAAAMGLLLCLAPHPAAAQPGPGRYQSFNVKAKMLCLPATQQ